MARPKKSAARRGFSRESVVEAAAALSDRTGFAALTMAALAQELGLALPSLYAHVHNLSHLRQQIAALATSEIGEAIGGEAQGVSRTDALFAVGRAYRRYAKRHPGRYAASQLLTDPSDAKHAAATTQVARAFYATLRGYGVKEPAATDAVRFMRSALHGFVDLELAENFAHPQDIDASFEQLLLAIDRALQTWPAAPRRRSQKSGKRPQ